LGLGFINQGTISAEGSFATISFYSNFTNQGTIEGLDSNSYLGLNTLNVGPALHFVQTAGVLRSPGTISNVYGVLEIRGGSAAAGILNGLANCSLILGNVAAGPTVPMTVGSLRQDSVTIHNTGLLSIPVATSRVTSRMDNLIIDGAGTFDIGFGQLDVTATAPATIRGYLINAYDPSGNADWSKPGITSSFAKNDPAKYSVGYAYGGDQSARDAGIGFLADGIGTNRTLVRAVLTGDANMDGTVNFFDLTQLLAYKYNTGQPASYTDGDLNYDGVVDFFDIVTLLSANYNSGQVFGPSGAVAPADVSQSVPEPSGVMLLAIGASAQLLIARRRRHNRLSAKPFSWRFAP
jgi:hypothetical protein